VSDIGVAVIGYGLAGAVFHAPLIAATPGLRVRAVVTGSPDRRRRAKEDFPDARLPATADELWSAIDDVGLVVVATPNHLHAPQAITALELGRAVVVDKPLARSTAEAGCMLEAAERTGGLLCVFHNRRWDSDFLLLRELVEQDRLGGLHRLEARFERYRPDVKVGTWRAEATAEQGGGLLLDLGSHLIDQALVLLGRPDAVYGEVARVRRGALADDDCFLSLRFKGGAHAHLWMSDVTPAIGPRWRAWGSREALEVWGLDSQEAYVRAGGRPGSPGYGEPDGGQRASLVGGGEPGSPGSDIRLPAGRAGDFYAGMAAAIRGESPVPVPAEAGMDVLAVVEAARRSEATQTVVAPQWWGPTP
jgi:predicted dehydrogenase